MKRTRATPPPHNVLRLLGRSPEASALLPPALGPLPPQLQGLDRAGRPKQIYIDRIALMRDAALIVEAERAIWSSAETTDARADAHWQSSACYREALRRATDGLLMLPWDRASDYAALDDDG